MDYIDKRGIKIFGCTFLAIMRVGVVVVVVVCCLTCEVSIIEILAYFLYVIDVMLH